MNRLLPLFAFTAISIFLLILAVEVPSIDLIIIVAVTLAFVAYDFFTSSRKDRD